MFQEVASLFGFIQAAQSEIVTKAKGAAECGLLGATLFWALDGLWPGLLVYPIPTRPGIVALEKVFPLASL